MADWARSLQSGFQTGLQLGESVRRRRLEDALAAEAGKFAPTEVVSGQDALRDFRENYVPAEGGISAADYEAQYLGGLQQRPAGYTVGGQDYASLAAAEQAAAPNRAAGLANVYRQFGDVGKAEEMMGLSRQSQLQNLQISEAQRQQDFNTALQDLNKQQFDTPEARTTAVLDVYRLFDPKGAVALESSYTQNELNKITLGAKKFENEYTQARAKGIDSVLKWYDSVNDGFTLERRGNQIIQTDTNGNQRVFAQGSDDEIMMRMDAIAKPGGFLELAKATADIARSKAQTEAIGPAATAENLRLNIGLADQYRKQISDIDARLLDYSPDSPEYKALRAQRNAVNRALVDVNKLLSPAGLTRGSGQAAAPGIDIEGARAIARTGVNPDTGKPFTKAEKDEYEKTFGEKFPEPEKASTPARPAATSPTGLSQMGTLGRLTPQSVLERAAQQGNPSAIAEIRRRQEAEAARQVVTPGYNQYGVF